MRLGFSLDRALTGVSVVLLTAVVVAAARDAVPVAPGTSVATGVTSGGGTAGSGQGGGQDNGGQGGALGPGGESSAGAGGATGGRLNSGRPAAVALPHIKIGFALNTTGASTAAMLGVAVPDRGNSLDQISAMVAWANAHGGIGGEQIDADVIDVDSDSTDPTQFNKVCTRATEDDHVFAMLGGTGNQDSPISCYAQHHTLLLDGEDVQQDTVTYSQSAPYVWLPYVPAEDQAIMAELDGLQAQGYFAADAKIGVVVQDFPAYHRMVDTQVTPRLHQLGYQDSNLDFEYVKNPQSAQDAGQVVQGIQAAAAKFSLTGVNHVFFIFPGGGAWLFFWEAAEQQHYHPRYGISSYDGPQFQQTNHAPADQLANTVGVGFSPATDVDDAHYAPMPNTAAESRCLDIMKASGLTFTSRANAETAFIWCDFITVLKQVGDTIPAGQLTREAWAARAAHLGKSWVSSLVLPGNSSLVPGRPEGSNGYRLLRYDGGCSCFRYNDGVNHPDPF